MDDFKTLIGKVATGATLTRDESAKAFDHMMSGEATPSQMGGLLMGLRLRGETVDWQSEFEAPLRRGVDTFRAYVRAWYDGRFQDIMFAKTQPPGIRRMIWRIGKRKCAVGVAH